MSTGEVRLKKHRLGWRWKDSTDTFCVVDVEAAYFQSGRWTTSTCRLRRTCLGKIEEDEVEIWHVILGIFMIDIDWLQMIWIHSSLVSEHLRTMVFSVLFPCWTTHFNRIWKCNEMNSIYDGITSHDSTSLNSTIAWLPSQGMFGQLGIFWAKPFQATYLQGFMSRLPVPLRNSYGMMIASSGISSRFGQKAPQFVENFRRTPVCLGIKTCSGFLLCKTEWLRSSSWPNCPAEKHPGKWTADNNNGGGFGRWFFLLSGGFLGSMFNNVNFPGCSPKKSFQNSM